MGAHACERWGLGVEQNWAEETTDYNTDLKPMDGKHGEAELSRKNLTLMQTLLSVGRSEGRGGELWSRDCPLEEPLGRRST